MSIRISLDELQKGIKGLVVMSTELEDIFVCIYEGRVPSGWLKGNERTNFVDYNDIKIVKQLLIFKILAYPSLKLLGSWTRDLVVRVEHFSTWAATTHPPLFFWLSAYTFPTGFLTAVLQVFIA